MSVTRLNDHRPPDTVIQIDVWARSGEAGCAVIGKQPTAEYVVRVLREVAAKIEEDPDRLERVREEVR